MPGDDLKSVEGTRSDGGLYILNRPTRGEGVDKGIWAVASTAVLELFATMSLAGLDLWVQKSKENLILKVGGLPLYVCILFYVGEGVGNIVRGGVEVIPEVDSRVSVWLGVVDDAYILS